MTEPLATARLDDGTVDRVARAIFPSVAPFAEVGCCNAPDFEKCRECANDVREIARDAISAYLQATNGSGS